MMSRIKKYMVLALLAAAVSVLAGCSSDKGILPDDVEEPVSKIDLLTLNLNVSYPGQQALTRADQGEQDGYVGPSGDFEKIKELRVIILHDLDANKTQGTVEANRLVATNDEGYPLYDNLEFKVKANEDKRIYLIANEDYLSVPQEYISKYQEPGQFLDSFKEGVIIKDLEVFADWTVYLPNCGPDVISLPAEVETGLFSPANNRRLPLTEFFDVFVKRTFETEDTFYANLFLTRAAAKANFFLDTSELFTTGEGIVNSKITAIKISGISTMEYVFPRNAEYNHKEKNELISISTSDNPSTGTLQAYITNFSVPQAATNPDRMVEYLIDGLNVTIREPETTDRPAEGDPIKVEDLSKFRLIQKDNMPIYFPESILIPNDKYPEGKYMVSVQINNNEWLTAPLETNILKIGTRDAIARNTYLPIVIKFLGAADIRVEVIPWTREDYYVDYTANVGFNEGDYLDFEGKDNQGQTGDFLSLNKTTGQLVLNFGKVAKGSFKISSPLGSTWDAYLVTTGGIQDAIQFQMPNPEYDPDNTTSMQPETINTTHISGNVGEPANFGIVATLAPGAIQNSATLMVIVTLADGTPVIANVVGDWPCSTGAKPINRLTVIENPL